MHFNPDAELDARLAGVALSALFSKYEAQYEGRKLIKAMKQHSAEPDAAKLALRLSKAVKAALADLELLVEHVASEGDDVPAGVSNSALLVAILRRLQDGWKADAAPMVKMIDVDGTAPAWADLGAMLGELTALDHGGGDSAAFPAEWYEGLLARYEARLGKAKPKTKTKKAPKKASAPPRVQPPDDQIIDYSPKGTFEVGQWIRHPTFGVGYVIESAHHVTLEFGPTRKVLTHVAQIAAPPQPKQRSSKSLGDTLELARAAGVDIKKVPARFEGEE